MKNKGIVLSIVGILLVSVTLVIFVKKNSNEYIMYEGAMLAITIDGDPATSIPTSSNYHAEIECTGGIGKYQPVQVVSNGVETDTYEMKFTIEDISASGAICNVDFTTINTTNKTNYLLATEINRKSSLSTTNGGICSKEQYTTSSTCTSNGGKWYVVHTNDGIRFAGKEPSNYVWFNNELWRIIGNIPTCMSKASDGTCSDLVNRVKIIRADSIGGLAFNGASSGTNTTWGGTGEETTINTLYTLLNEKYYGKVNATGASPCYGYSNSSYGLCNYEKIGISNSGTDYYGKMIQSVYMNVGMVSSTSTMIDATYDLEVGTLTTNATRIGLMTASDYGYATSGITYSSVELSSLNSNTLNNWLYTNGYEWTITPYSALNLLHVNNSGYVYIFGYEDNDNAVRGSAVRPILYLDSSVYVIGGDGSLLNPYIIGM